MRHVRNAAFAIALFAAAVLLLGAGYDAFRDLDPYLMIPGDGTFGWGGTHKFGFNDDIDNTIESIWEGNDFGGPARCPFDSTPFTLFVSSSSAGDTQDVEIELIDGDWNLQTLTVTLAGQTAVQVGSATDTLRINRAFNLGTTNFVGTVYFHIDPTPTAGVPDTPITDIKTVISIGNNQTQQACYSVADNHTSYIVGWSVGNLDKGGAAGDPATVRIVIYGEDGVMTRVQTITSVSSGGHMSNRIYFPIVCPARTAIEVTAVGTGAASNLDLSASFDVVLER